MAPQYHPSNVNPVLVPGLGADMLELVVLEEENDAEPPFGKN